MNIEQPSRIVSESEFPDTCRTKCVQIQNNQFKSSIAMRPLCISNHNDEILAQFVWQIRPITIVQAIAHMFITFGRQFTKIAVQKEIGEGHWCHKKQKYQLKIGIFHLLQQQNKRISIHSRFCAWFFSWTEKVFTKSNWNMVHAKKNVLQIKRIKMIGLYSSVVSVNQLESLI